MVYFMSSGATKRPHGEIENQTGSAERVAVARQRLVPYGFRTGWIYTLCLSCDIIYVFLFKKRMGRGGAWRSCNVNMLVVGKLWFFSTWITVGRVGLEAGGWGLPAPAALPGILFLKRVAPPSWLEESLVNKCCLFLFCFENKVASPSWLEGALVNKWICFCFWESLFFVWGVWLLYFIFTRQILGGPCQRQTVFLTIIWKSAWYYIQIKYIFSGNLSSRTWGYLLVPHYGSAGKNSWVIIEVTWSAYMQNI